MNGIVIRDVVFEQTYQKQMIKACDRAYYDGLMAGMASVVSMIEFLHQKDPTIVINAQTIRDHLKTVSFSC